MTSIVTRPHSSATYLRQSLTSACLLTSILRALFCEVARPKLTVHFIYRTVVDTGMHMSRFNLQEPNYTTEFPLYSSPHPIIIPGRRRGRRRPPAVGCSYLSINTWSLLPPNFSPALAIHQQAPTNYVLSVILMRNF